MKFCGEYFPVLGLVCLGWLGCGDIAEPPRFRLGAEADLPLYRWQPFCPDLDARQRCPPSDQHFNAVAGSEDGKVVWAVGVFGAMAHWNGDAWVAGQNASCGDVPTRETLNDVWVSKEGDRGWAVGEKGTLLQLDNDCWTVQDLGEISQELYAIDFSPKEETGWIVGEGFDLRYRDRWKTEGRDLEGAFTDVAVSETGQPWVVGQQLLATRTPDGWVSYEDLEHDFSSIVLDPEELDGAPMGFAGGNRGIVRFRSQRIRREVHFTEISLNPSLDFSLRDAWLQGKGRGWAVGYGVLVSLQGWPHPREEKIPDEDQLEGVWLNRAATTGWAVGRRGVFYQYEGWMPEAPGVEPVGGGLWRRLQGGFRVTLEGPSEPEQIRLAVYRADPREILAEDSCEKLIDTSCELALEGGAGVENLSGGEELSFELAVSHGEAWEGRASYDLTTTVAPEPYSWWEDRIEPYLPRVLWGALVIFLLAIAVPFVFVYLATRSPAVFHVLPMSEAESVIPESYAWLFSFLPLPLYLSVRMRRALLSHHRRSQQELPAVRDAQPSDNLRVLVPDTEGADREWLPWLAALERLQEAPRGRLWSIHRVPGSRSSAEVVDAWFRKACEEKSRRPPLRLVFSSPASWEGIARHLDLRQKYADVILRRGGFMILVSDPGPDEAAFCELMRDVYANNLVVVADGPPGTTSQLRVRELELKEEERG